MSLDLIRRKHKWFTRIVLIFISVTFILGIGYFTSDMGAMSGAGGGSAAEVNGEDISFSLYYIERGRIEQQFKQQGLSDLSEFQTQIDMMALQNVVDRRLLAQKAAELGFVANDDDVNTIITSDPRFQENGRFIGKDAYEQLIKQYYNIEPSQFEDYVREQILLQKIITFMDQTARVTDENLIEAFNNENEKIDLYYITFSKSAYMDDYTPTDEEVEKYYESAKSRFMTPEMRKIKYIVLQTESFENTVEVSGEEIDSYYQAYREEFMAEDGSIKKLDEVRDQIAAELRAKRGEISMRKFLQNIEGQGDDRKDLQTIAAEQGGMEIMVSEPFAVSDIRDDIPPNVVKSAFEIGKGTTRVMPLGTNIWVIEVAEIYEPREKTLEEASDEVIGVLKEQHAVTEARNKAYEAHGKLKEIKKHELQEKAESLDLELKETGLFSRIEAVPGIPVNNLNTEAFEIDRERPVAQKVYSDGDSYFIVSVKEVREADTSEFEENKESLKAQQLMAQRNTIAQSLIQDLRREAEVIPNNKLFSN